MEKGTGIGGVLALLGCAALFFVVRGIFPGISNIILTVAGLIIFLLLALVVVAFALAVKSSDKKKGASENDSQTLLNAGRSHVTDMRRLAIGTKNREIRLLSENIASTSGRILSELKNRPDEVQRSRKFLSYYLPTTAEVVRKYVRLEEGGLADSETEVKTASCLRDISIAMERQYANLFDSDVLDLSVEMKTLAEVCRRDGLLDGEKYKLTDGKNDIDLVL